MLSISSQKLQQILRVLMLIKLHQDLKLNQFVKIWMALPSPTFNMCIRLSKYLFSDGFRIFIPLKRKFRKIFLSTNAWVWVHLFSFFSCCICFNYAPFLFRRICFHLFCLFFGTWELPTLLIHSKIFKRSCMGSIPCLRNGTWRTTRTFENYQILESLWNVMSLSTTASAQNF